MRLAGRSVATGGAACFGAWGAGTEGGCASFTAPGGGGGGRLIGGGGGGGPMGGDPLLGGVFGGWAPEEPGGPELERRPLSVVRPPLPSPSPELDEPRVLSSPPPLAAAPPSPPSPEAWTVWEETAARTSHSRRER